MAIKVPTVRLCDHAKLALIFTATYIALTFHIRRMLLDANGLQEPPPTFQESFDYQSLGPLISIPVPAALCALNFYLVFLIVCYASRDRYSFITACLCWLGLATHMAWTTYTLAFYGIVLPIARVWPLATAFFFVTTTIAVIFSIFYNRYREKVVLLNEMAQNIAKEKQAGNGINHHSLNTTPNSAPLVNRDKQFISRIEAVLMDGIQEPDFNVDRMAQKLALERSTLFRKTQQHFNTSPSELITQSRLAWAKRLLEEDGGTVTEIALTVGYNSSAHFSYSFKKKFNCTPSAYRKRIVQTNAS
ncbi:helix-turn-helix transcriptional regulator [Hahella sp. CCB-MM4]|uniref:helix-turn-helix transcriptional regulator n=1 Tax=Hahella sp. (strain CCB-MM4) TaxID=1926491 RepID=UPI00143E02C6|nr:AraC family transcriptional regulator [Hahella sp. CCB-MM4]